MAGIEVKKFDSPDEVRAFQGNGQAEIVNIGGQAVLRGTFEPGWQWSKNIKPIAGTDSCESPHFLYCLEGRMAVRMNDGTEEEIGPGDVVKIEPGHDAWVVGDKACKAVDFGAMGTYAKKG
jgi:mannose-6-phosphate isomerase-like protein (cupin superfamily)